MAYSPVEQGRLPAAGALAKIAQKYDATPFQIALAWLLHKPGVMAIPKASAEAHVRANRGALDIALEAEDLALIDAEFPAPVRKRPLEML
jgi:diketogulonate reductase-like aldo/keto reductase